MQPRRRQVQLLHRGTSRVRRRMCWAGQNGYAEVGTAADGRAAGARVAAQSQEARTGRAWTPTAVAALLAVWAGQHPPHHPASHAGYIEQFLIPHLGHVRLAELTSRQLAVAFTPDQHGAEPVLPTPHTVDFAPHPDHPAGRTQRLRLGRADHGQPGPPGRASLSPRPRAVVWTPARVALWQATGTRPGMVIWTPAGTQPTRPHRLNPARSRTPLWHPSPYLTNRRTTRRADQPIVPTRSTGSQAHSIRQGRMPAVPSRWRRRRSAS